MMGTDSRTRNFEQDPNADDDDERAVQFADVGDSDGDNDNGDFGVLPDTDDDVYELLDRDEVPLVVRGRLLGYASSQREEHTHDPGYDYADRGERCAACRWLEVRIFTVTGELSAGPDEGDEDDEVFDEPRARYLVLTYGITIVPNEIVRHRAAWTDSAFEIVTLLSQRRHEQTFVPLTSQRALAQAASRDPGIRDAFINCAGPTGGRRT